MPEMITVRCPRCGKKLLFSPFDNYKKATLECPGCHYTGLVETYPEIPTVPQSHGQQSHSDNGNGNQNPTGASSSNRAGSSASASASSGSNSNSTQSSRPRNPRVQSNGGIRDLDERPSRNSSRQRSNSASNDSDEPTGFALKFPWVIAGLALAIIILYVCLQGMSTNEVI